MDWVETALGEGLRFVAVCVAEGVRAEERERDRVLVRDTVLVTLRLRVGLLVPEVVLAFVQVFVGVLSPLPLGEALEVEEEQGVLKEVTEETAVVVEEEVDAREVEGEEEEEGEEEREVTICRPLLFSRF